MWCSACNQEVPVVAVGGAKSDGIAFGEMRHESVSIVCTRCQSVIESGPSKWSRIDDAHVALPDAAPQSSGSPGAHVDDAGSSGSDGESNDRGESIVGVERSTYSLPEFSSDANQPLTPEPRFGDGLRLDHDLLQAKVAINSFRTDNVQNVSNTRHDPASRTRRPRDVARPDSVGTTQTSDGEAMRWRAVFLGIIVSTFGGVLAFWSVLSGSQRLWHIGLPACLMGQTILIFALAMQLDRLWKMHQQTLGRVGEATSGLGRDLVMHDQNDYDQINSAR